MRLGSSKNIIKIAVVDDEQVQANELQLFLKDYFQKLKLEYNIEVFSSADEFLSTFSKGKYTIIFMDIKMSGTDGMTAAKQIRVIDQDVVLIFVTNMFQFVFQGYEVHAFDYILKPFNYYDFEIKMFRLLKEKNNFTNSRVTISTKERDVLIDISQIKYIDILGHCLTYHTTNGDYIETYGSLGSVINELDKFGFALSDKSFYINLKYVNGLDNEFVYLGNEKIKLARRRKIVFGKALENYLLNQGGQR